MRAAPLLLIVGAALAVPAGREAAAQSFVPPIGRPQTGPACIRVINTTDYWFPVQIAVPGQGEPATFRIEKREFRQFCATVALRPGERIEVVLRSFIQKKGCNDSFIGDVCEFVATAFKQLPRSTGREKASPEHLILIERELTFHAFETLLLNF